MKNLYQTPTYLLALIFLIFGANFFFHFIPMPPMTGDAGAFTGLLYTTGFLKLVKILEIGIAVLLVVKRTTALALLLIAPIVLNIFLFEVIIANQVSIGILLVLLNAIAIYQNRNKYWSIIA